MYVPPVQARERVALAAAGLQGVQPSSRLIRKGSLELRSGHPGGLPPLVVFRRGHRQAVDHAACSLQAASCHSSILNGQCLYLKSDFNLRLPCTHGQAT